MDYYLHTRINEEVIERVEKGDHLAAGDSREGDMKLLIYILIISAILFGSLIALHRDLPPLTETKYGALTQHLLDLRKIMSE